MFQPCFPVILAFIDLGGLADHMHLTGGSIICSQLPLLWTRFHQIQSLERNLGSPGCGLMGLLDVARSEVFEGTPE